MKFHNLPSRLWRLQRLLGYAVAHWSLDILADIDTITENNDLITVHWADHLLPEERLVKQDAWESLINPISVQQLASPLSLLINTDCDAPKPFWYERFQLSMGWAWDLDSLLLKQDPDRWYLTHGIDTWLTDVAQHPDVTPPLYQRQIARLRLLYAEFRASLGDTIFEAGICRPSNVEWQGEEDVGDGVVLEDAFCTRTTERACLVVHDRQEIWIPKSQIRPASEVWEWGSYGRLIVSPWLAQEKGLVTEE